MKMICRKASVLLVTFFMFVACAQDNMTENGTEIIPEKQQNTTKVKISMDAGFAPKQDSRKMQGTRSLDNLEFVAGKLRPKFSSDNKADVIMLFGNTSKVTRINKEWNYDKESGVLSYHGDVDVPSDMLADGNLKLMLAVYPQGALQRDGTIKAERHFEQQNNNADGQTLPFAVPYFSDWLQIGSVVQASIKVTKDRLLLRPQGMIMKVVASNEQTRMDGGVMLRGFRFESNVMSEQGIYRLPNNTNETFRYEAKDEGNSIVKVYDEMLKSSIEFTNNRQVFYKWVEKRNDFSQSQPYTRSYLILQYNNPILSHSYTNAWWDGATTADPKIIAAGYNNNPIENNGATNTLKLTNLNGFTPIDRFAYSVTTLNVRNTDVGHQTDDMTPLNMTTWADRQYSTYNRYTQNKLNELNLLGNSPSGFRPTGNAEPNSQKVEWRIPTIADICLLLPVRSNGAIGAFKLFNSNTNTSQAYDNIDETVRFDTHKAAVQTLKSSYKLSDKVVYACRFMGSDNLHKTFYRYRTVGDGVTNYALQIQTFYAGPYFPEIDTVEKMLTYFNNLSQATFIRPLGNTTTNNKHQLQWATEERLLATSRDIYYSGTSGQSIGNSYWLNEPGGSTVFWYDFRQGRLEQRSSTGSHTVLMVRDF